MAQPAEAMHEPPMPRTLDAFLADVSARAYRFAELGLRHREDALDAVQDAMTRMLGYRDRPAQEWTALFWTILRSRIVDIQRRRMFRLSWIGEAGDREGEAAMLRADARRTPESQLTPREQQILARLAQGRSYGAIAADLSVSYKTVTNACSQMRQKLGVRTLAELIHVAVTHAQRQG